MKKYDITSKLDKNLCGFYEWNKPLYLVDEKDERADDFKKQKNQYGFSNDETWSLDSSIIIFVLPRIKRFRNIIKTTGGYPGCLKNKKEWLNILDKIILSFNLMYQENFDGKIITEKQQQKINEGLKLFGEYFQALWW